MSRVVAAGDRPAEWWRSAVVYQIYPRSFADSDGDGVGDLRGILNRIDHLADLGVDVVWLSPIYPSPHDDNGYDVRDYLDVDPVYGDLATLDELVDAVHARGMRIVLDLVVNHTSDEHPWFQESRDPASARRDWYWWRPARPGFEPGTPGAEPNNWGSFFSGPAWEFDPQRGEYYLHLFSRRQPDLNWELADVRQAVYAVMHWWLRRGIDGFRMDVINFISKHPELPDAPVPPGGRYGDGFPFFGYGPRIHEFLQEMRREVFDRYPRTFLTVGEMPGVLTEQAARFTDPDRRELDMVFQFDHMGVDAGPGGKWDRVPLDRRRLVDSLVRWQDALRDRGWNSLYWNNHDQPRVVSRFGDPDRYWYESATALAAVLHLQKGTPFIYQGEELGMTNMPFGSLDELRDIESINFARDSAPRDVLPVIREVGRDNSRTPVQWDSGPNAGFTTGTPWIGVNPNAAWLNAAAQRGRDGSVFEFYRALIRLRHDDPVVVHGDFRELPAGGGAVFAFMREGAPDLGPSLLVVANLSSEPADVDLRALRVAAGAAEGWSVALANHRDPDPSARGLRPWEVVVLRAPGRRPGQPVTG